MRRRQGSRLSFVELAGACAALIVGIAACAADENEATVAPPAAAESSCSTSSVYESLRPVCVSCHASGTKSPFFESQERFEALLANDARLVVAGKPDESELVRLLEGRGTGATKQMPPTGPSFAELTRSGGARASMDDVRCWIQQRASFTCPQDSVAVWPADLRRLTRAEVEASVEAIFGIAPTKYPRPLPDDLVSDGFDNQAAVLGVSDFHVSRYQTLAEYIGAQTATTLRAKLVACDPATDAKCLESFVRKTGRRIYRRPLTEDEVGAIVSLKKLVPATDKWAPFATAVEAMLQSPKFLFRVEVGEPDPERPGLFKLTGWEVATRLSYLLTMQPPDDALLDAAERGELSTREGIEGKARALLADPRAKVALRGFTSQWFRIRDLADIELDPARYPKFTSAVRAGMAAEMQALVDDHVASGSFLDVYSASYGYVTPATAAIYGLAAPAAPGPSRVDWSSDRERGGLLSMAGALTVTSQSTNPSAVARGLYVRDAAMCDPPPPPPPNVPDLEVDANESSVDAEERHSKDPACSTCHKKLDPIGWGLDRFDAMGMLRTTNEVGRPVRTAGRVDGLDPAEFAGGKELGTRLRAAEPQIAECATRKLARYAYGAGQPKDPVAQCAIDRLRGRFQSGGFRWSELVVALVTSDEFRWVRGGK